MEIENARKRVQKRKSSAPTKIGEITWLNVWSNWNWFDFTSFLPKLNFGLIFVMCTLQWAITIIDFNVSREKKNYIKSLKTIRRGPLFHGYSIFTVFLLPFLFLGILVVLLSLVVARSNPIEIWSKRNPSKVKMKKNMKHDRYGDDAHHFTVKPFLNRIFWHK